MGDLFDLHADLTVTRVEFERLCEPFFKRAIDIVKRTLQHVKLSANAIDEVFIACLFPEKRTSF